MSSHCDDKVSLLVFYINEIGILFTITLKRFGIWSLNFAGVPLVYDHACRQYVNVISHVITFKLVKKMNSHNFVDIWPRKPFKGSNYRKFDWLEAGQQKQFPVAFQTKTFARTKFRQSWIFRNIPYSLLNVTPYIGNGRVQVQKTWFSY